MLTLAITNKIKILCSFAIGLMYSGNASSYIKKSSRRSFNKRLNTCYEIGIKAGERGINVPLAIAIGFHESRFSYSPSDKGAKGPLGVLPKYHCKEEKKCDLIDAGLSALEKFSAINKDVCNTLAQYNAGLEGGCKKGTIGKDYATQVLRFYSLYEIIYSETELLGESDGSNSPKPAETSSGGKKPKKP